MQNLFDHILVKARDRSAPVSSNGDLLPSIVHMADDEICHPSGNQSWPENRLFIEIGSQIIRGIFKKSDISYMPVHVCLEAPFLLGCRYYKRR